MDDQTEKNVQRVLERLLHVRSYRCRYHDLSFQSDIDAQRVVEVYGGADGRVRLNTLNGSPTVETVISQERLIRVDHSNRTGYRIDFTRHPFSDFHRFGWLCVDRPFSLFNSENLVFRAEIGEASPVLLFQGGLNPGLLPGRSRPEDIPSAQFKVDSRTGLLRELLIASRTEPQRFLFTDFVVNKPSKRRDRELEPEWELGDMTELYWNQIQAMQWNDQPPAAFFSWN
ncbi:MAG TPA: hypothetical protein VMW69_11680 [Spirochaetia bacterium]|nr:hypothetical protein [Spirochaetia bacterium]